MFTVYSISQNPKGISLCLMLEFQFQMKHTYKKIYGNSLYFLFNYYYYFRKPNSALKI